MKTYELDGPRYLNNLKDMLYGMLQSFVLTDVTLVCDDKRQFQAQKIYLSAKSFEINEISNQGKPEENVKMDKSNTTLNFCTTILDEKSEKGKQKMQIILKIYKLILLNLRNDIFAICSESSNLSREILNKSKSCSHRSTQRGW